MTLSFPSERSFPWRHFELAQDTTFFEKEEGDTPVIITKRRTTRGGRARRLRRRHWSSGLLLSGVKRHLFHLTSFQQKAYPLDLARRVATHCRAHYLRATSHTGRSYRRRIPRRPSTPATSKARRLKRHIITAMPKAEPPRTALDGARKFRVSEIVARARQRLQRALTISPNGM